MKRAGCVGVLAEWNGLHVLDLGRPTFIMKELLLIDLRDLHLPDEIVQTSFACYRTGRPGIQPRYTALGGISSFIC
jgi:hypothetical protein